MRASTARRYELIGDLDTAAVSAISSRLPANDTIEQHSLGPIPPSFDAPATAGARVESVTLSGLADADLVRLSRERLLSLDLAEMHAIQDHFGREGRDPTDAELETLAQTWSEHCMHKTFRARVRLEHTRAGRLRHRGSLRRSAGGAPDGHRGARSTLAPLGLRRQRRHRGLRR